MDVLELDESGLDDAELVVELEFTNEEELLLIKMEDWRELFCEPPLEPPQADTNVSIRQILSNFK